MSRYTDKNGKPKKSLFSRVFIALCRPFNRREVTVAKCPPSQYKEYYKYEQISPSGMSLLTENFLHGNLLQSSREKTPKLILETAEEFFKVSRDPVYRLVAADLCRFFAGKAPKKEKIQFYLSSCRFSYLTLFESSRRKATNNIGKKEVCHLPQAIQLYNESVAGIFRVLKSMQLLQSEHFTFRGVAGTEYIFEKPQFCLSVPLDAVSDFSLCSDYRVKALRLINRHSGIGVPLVAKIAPKKLNKAIITPPGMTIPVTLFLRARILEGDKMILTPCYFDTSIQEKFPLLQSFLGQDSWPLARDFSTPFACFMNSLVQRNLLSAMLNPVKYDRYSGLYMVEPYRPNKIPVVFVHGLMSSPETWGQMLNSLKYDPRIRQHYQFWFFAYSTGSPVPYVAKKLSRALQFAQQGCCTTPEATANFHKLVLVGHSMGGLIARVLLLKDPEAPFKRLTGRNWKQLKEQLSEKEANLLSKILPLQEVSPCISRAIFMATPHRGSKVARRKIASLGTWLIRLPQKLQTKEEPFRKIWQKLMPDTPVPWAKKHFVTGIDNLHPDSLFVRSIGLASLNTDIPCHSIIGNRQASGVAGGSDGIVPYTSSHIDNVESECIVRSDHSVHRSPEAIREVLRILLLHLQETNRTPPVAPQE